MWHAFLAGTGRLSSSESHRSCHFSTLPGVKQGIPALCQPAAAGPHSGNQSSRQSTAALLKVPLVSRVYDGEQLQLPARVQFVDPNFLSKCVVRRKLLAPVDHPLQVSPDCFPRKITSVYTTSQARIRADPADVPSGAVVEAILCTGRSTQSLHAVAPLESRSCSAWTLLCCPAGRV